MPLVETGGFDELRVGRRRARARLRVARRGAGARRDRRRRCCATLGLEEGDLACGAARAARRRAARGCCASPGSAPTRLHNNCSGQARGDARARAMTAGWPTRGLRARGAPGAAGRARQRRATGPACRRERHRLRGRRLRRRRCSRCRSTRMARAYARLAARRRRGDDVPARIVHAMRTRPFLVGGTDRFDTVLMEETDGACSSQDRRRRACTRVALLGARHRHRAQGGGRRAARAVSGGAARCCSARRAAAELPPRLAEFTARGRSATRAARSSARCVPRRVSARAHDRPRVGTDRRASG